MKRLFMDGRILNRELIKEVRSKDGKNLDFTLGYYLITKKKSNQILFKIEIEKRSLKDKRTISENSGWLSCDREKVLKKLKLMAKNTVTPASLAYVIDDISES